MSRSKDAIPGTPLEDCKRLLSFIVVGGGPTSCEFVSELHDFTANDVKKLFPELIKHAKVSFGKCSVECLQNLLSSIPVFA